MRVRWHRVLGLALFTPGIVGCWQHRDVYVMRTGDATAQANLDPALQARLESSLIALLSASAGLSLLFHRRR